MKRMGLPVTSALSDMPTPWCTSYLGLRPLKIEIVASTEGSSIVTGWNRRSSAASLPIVLRNSSARAVESVWYQCTFLGGRTCGGSDELQAAREGGLDHLSGIDTALRLPQIEQRVFNEPKSVFRIDVSDTNGTHGLHQ